MLGPTLIQLFFWIGENNEIVLSNYFAPSEILEFWGTALSAIATVLLGVIALRQNEVFKNENDISQTKLNNAVNKLAEANNIIAATNTKLFALEEKNQKIQLVLAQKLIPFLEFYKLEIKSCDYYSAPTQNEFTLKQQVGSLRENVKLGQTNYKRQIAFDLSISKKSNSDKYHLLKFEFDLLNHTEAKISTIEIKSIKLSNSSKEITFDSQDLNQNLIHVPNFLLSDWAIYNASIVFSDDYYSIVNDGVFDLIIELLITITTGVVFKEEIKFNNKIMEAKYILEVQ